MDIKKVVHILLYAAPVMRCPEIFLLLPTCSILHEQHNVIDLVLPLAVAITNLLDTATKSLSMILMQSFINVHINVCINLKKYREIWIKIGIHVFSWKNKKYNTILPFIYPPKFFLPVSIAVPCITRTTFVLFWFGFMPFCLHFYVFCICSSPISTPGPPLLLPCCAHLFCVKSFISLSVFLSSKKVWFMLLFLSCDVFESCLRSYCSTIYHFLVAFPYHYNPFGFLSTFVKKLIRIFSTCFPLLLFYNYIFRCHKP